MRFRCDSNRLSWKSLRRGQTPNTQSQRVEVAMAVAAKTGVVLESRLPGNSDSHPVYLQKLVVGHGGRGSQGLISKLRGHLFSISTAILWSESKGNRNGLS